MSAIIILLVTLLAPLLGIASPKEEMSPLALVEIFSDPHKSEGQKERAETALVRQGTKAIPLLIEHLEDKREAGRETYIPGSCYNQPPPVLGEGKAEPLSDDCNKPHVRMITLGERSEEILYRIITPNYFSPYARGRDRGKMGFNRPFVVKDWKKWWKKHRKQDLAKIHDQAKKLIDQFWREDHWPNPIEWR